MAITDNLLALDVGERRIGVAVSRAGVDLATPLVTLRRSDTVLQEIQELIADNKIGGLVVGLPRGLDGQETTQTTAVRQFVQRLQNACKMPVALQDEALTSRKAEAELVSRARSFDKAEVDALAATYILEDYIAEHH